jgi:hypothetical protein
MSALVPSGKGGPRHTPCEGQLLPGGVRLRTNVSHQYRFIARPGTNATSPLHIRWSHDPVVIGIR